MKKSWFEHFPMSELEANELIKKYKKRGVKAEKHITFDPGFFTVKAFLPFYENFPKASNYYRSQVWS